MYAYGAIKHSEIAVGVAHVGSTDDGTSFRTTGATRQSSSIDPSRIDPSRWRTQYTSTRSSWVLDGLIMITCDHTGHMTTSSPTNNPK